MAKASDTMRYLVKSFDIAPAGTREEGQAAKGLSEVFHEHGLETANKSFRFSPLSKVATAGAAILMAFAALLSGAAGGALPVVMLVFALIAAAVFVLETLGIRTVSRFSMTGSSQNVVARHPAATTVNGQKARPVVVIAHYDTPRADIFSIPVLSHIKPYLRLMVTTFMAVDLVAVLFQVLPMPALLQNITWGMAVVASILLILWGASVIMHKFVMPFTVGANDNKAAIAAMFGLLDRVRPLQSGNGFGPNPTLYEAMEAETGTALTGVNDTRVRVSERRARLEEEAEASVRTRSRRSDEPVRYGADVVRTLNLLPTSCELEYQAETDGARVHRASVATSDTQAAAAVAGATVVMTRASDTSESEVSGVSTAVEEPAMPLDPEAAKDAVADAIMAGLLGANTMSGSQAPQTVAPAGATANMDAIQGSSSFRLITSSDDLDVELHGAAVTGSMPRDVLVQSAEVSSSFTVEDPEQSSSSVVNDPMWGTASFRPVGAGRRILGDIPDPAVAAVDPFGVSSIETVGTYNPEDFSQLDFETGKHQTITPAMLEYERRNAMGGFGDDITEKRGRKGKRGRQGRISQQAARMQSEMQEESFNDWLGLEEGFDAKSGGQQIGSWDNFNDDPGQQSGYSRWQGGAARARRNGRSEGNNAPEVRRAAMTLGDRDLIAHEIWFVLTGASEADHAGVEDFLRTYRNDLRGAYFINLECVGAGRQSLVLEEGVGRSVKADRRLVNLFGEASLGINRPMALTRMGWRDTEATPVLRQGCRAVTVSGVINGAPAYSRWVGDTPEKVDAAMIDDVVDVLVEVIKNA